jgi:putative phosphoribosyl transferase
LTTGPTPAGRDEEVEVWAGPMPLRGHLTVPASPSGAVVFAHGSGSSRHSPRNRFVAGGLNRSGLATLVFDLLTPGEEQDRDKVFDIALLGDRLLEVTRWLRAQPLPPGQPVGYFGASTGAGAALWAAAGSGNEIAAIVSRGGRPDLAGPRLSRVQAPTLLIVGGRDHQVLELNRQALAQMSADCRLQIVEGATHLFTEHGALEAVAEHAREWFCGHMDAAAAV